MLLEHVFVIGVAAFLLLSCRTSRALIIGSDSAVSRQAFVSFPAADSDNTALGFAALDYGFFLEDQTTSATFNAFFPPNCSVGLNGGICYLSEDLNLPSFCEMMSSGSVKGNWHAISFSPQKKSRPFPVTGLSVLLDDQSAGATVYSVGWSPDNLFVLAGTANKSGNEINIYGWNSVSHTLTFATSQQSKIYAHATLFFDQGITFSYYPSGAANDCLAMENLISGLHLYEVTSYIQATGLVLTNGMLTIEGDCPLYAGGGLYLQDGNPAHNISLNILPESGIRIISGSLYR